MSPAPPERFTGVAFDFDFDVDFLEDGKIENRGLEVWQLGKTGAGWKIVSILWTSKGR